jgi:deoxycytidylate deaminase
MCWHKNELPRLFKPAMEASKEAIHHQHHIGCAIYYKNKLISSGYNNNDKTHPLCKDYYKIKLKELGVKEGDNHPLGHKFTDSVSIHAEVSALIKAKKFLQNLSESDKRKVFIVNYRANSRGELAMARPCSGCSKVLRDFGITKGIWTTNGGFEAGEI